MRICRQGARRPKVTERLDACRTREAESDLHVADRILANGVEEMSNAQDYVGHVRTSCDLRAEAATALPSTSRSWMAPRGKRLEVPTGLREVRMSYTRSRLQQT
eukprot:scaffold5981_cov27-Tisochrysis_lutea.AAC.2